MPIFKIPGQVSKLFTLLNWLLLRKRSFGKRSFRACHVWNDLTILNSSCALTTPRNFSSTKWWKEIFHLAYLIPTLKVCSSFRLPSLPQEGSRWPTYNGNTINASLQTMAKRWHSNRYRFMKKRENVLWHNRTWKTIRRQFDNDSQISSNADGFSLHNFCKNKTYHAAVKIVQIVLWNFWWSDMADILLAMEYWW